MTEHFPPSITIDSLSEERRPSVSRGTLDDNLNPCGLFVNGELGRNRPSRPTPVR